MPPCPALKIFVSSPGDVGEERILAGRVLERLRSEWIPRADLEGIFWEHEPLRATEDFQSQIIPPAETDIVVCILWSRLGTRLPPSLARPDGSRYDSGTQYELETATESWQLRRRPELLVYRKTVVPVVKEANSAAALERVTQRIALERFLDGWFQNGDGSLRAAFHPFESPAQFEDLLEEHLRRLLERLAPASEAGSEPAVRPVWTSGSPFRGLAVFEREHAPVFFGRTREVSQILDALRAQAAAGRAFVLVLGASGSGKSSLVRAGVLPLLTEPGVVEGVGLWRSALFVPSLSAGDLSGGLAQAALLQPEGNSEQQPETRLVLVIDQMEEIFTLAQVTPSARQDFVAALSALVRSGRVWVIGTLRSDFYARCEEIPGLLDLMTGRGPYHLRPPGPAEIGQIIRRPAEAAGLRFQERLETRERLDDLLLQAAAQRPESLPLLEFTLDQLYQRRTGNELTFQAYDEIGGIEGAIGKRAEEVFAEQPPEVQAALPSVLRHLVTVRPEADLAPASQRAPREDFREGTPAKSLVDAFVAARIFVADAADDGRPTVRLTHEALLTNWPRAEAWLRQDRGFLKARAWVDQDASRWEQEGQHAGLLIPPGKALDDAKSLLNRDRNALRPVLVQYIEDSLAEARKSRSRTLWRYAAIALLVLLLATLAPLAFRLRQQRRQSLADGDVKQAHLFIQADRADHALAHLARALRQDAESLSAQSLVTRLLLDRSWRLPVAEFWPGDLDSLVIGEEGHFFATAAKDGTVRVWETRTLRPAGKAFKPPELNLGPEPQLSRDGRRILIYHDPEQTTAQVWDAQAGRPVGEPWRARSVMRLSPDGEWMVAVSSEGDLLLRQGATGRTTTLPLEGNLHDEPLFSSDGRRLVLEEYSSSAFLTLWDLPSGRRIRKVPGEGRISGYTFSPDGRRLAVLSAEPLTATGHLRVLDASSGEEIVSTPSRDAISLDFSPDGTRILATDSDTVHIWRPFPSWRQQRPVRLDRESRPSHVELSSDGQLLLVLFESDQEAQLWNVQTGIKIGGPIRDVTAARFLPGTRRVVAMSRDRGIRIWSAEPVQAVTEVVHASESRTLITADFSLDGSRMLTIEGAMPRVDEKPGSILKVWDSETGRPLMKPLHSPPGFFFEALISTDGRRIAASLEPYKREESTASKQLEFQIWDVQNGRPFGTPIPVTILPDRGFVRPSPDAEKLAVYRGKELEIWNARSGRWITRITSPGGDIRRLRFSDDGRHIITVGEEDTTARIWEAHSGHAVAALTHPRAVLIAGLSSDGLRVATVTSDRTVRVWSSAGELLAGPFKSEGEVSNLAFDGEGSRLLTVATDGALQIWNIETGETIGETIRHKDPIRSAQFSPDGLRVLTESYKTLCFWDVRTGQLLGECITAEGDRYRTPRFSPDGRRVWVAADRTVNVFDAPIFPHGDARDLALLAEAVGGFELDEAGKLSPLRNQVTRLDSLRRKTAASPPGKATAQSLIRWFLSDPRQRTLSPLSRITIEEYMRRHLQEENKDPYAWDEAAMTFPAHPLLFRYPRPPGPPIPPPPPPP